MGKTTFKLTKVFEAIIRHEAPDLKKLMQQRLEKNYSEITNADGYLYAKGEIPVLLVAHMDTVHKSPVKSLCVSSDGVLMSPQGIGGDDRCGIYIIDMIINYCVKQNKPLPHILFTEEEETGCVGAKKFVKATNPEDFDFKYIIEYDRKGNNDCVFYSCDNKEFTEWVETFGWKKAYGSCSDISHIAPHLKTAAVNLSSGYYNAHHTDEYIVLEDVYVAIVRGINMLEAVNEAPKFEYIPTKTYNYSANKNYGTYGKGGAYNCEEYDDYYGYGGYNYGGYPNGNVYAGNITMSTTQTTAKNKVTEEIKNTLSKEQFSDKEQKEIQNRLKGCVQLVFLKPIDFDTGAYLILSDGQYVIEGDYFINQYNTIFRDTDLGIPVPVYSASLYTAQGTKAHYSTTFKETPSIEQLAFYSPTLYDTALIYFKNKYPDKFKLLFSK